MTIDEDFYNSTLAEQMAKEFDGSRQRLLLLEGQSLLKSLRCLYCSSSIATVKEQAQEYEIRFCNILLALWKETDNRQRKRISELLIGCCKRLESLL